MVRTTADSRGGPERDEPEETPRPARTPLAADTAEQLPAMKTLLAMSSYVTPVTQGLDGTRTKIIVSREMPRCPKCAQSDLVEPEGRSGTSGPWFVCSRCQAIFFQAVTSSVGGVRAGLSSTRRGRSRPTSLVESARRVLQCHDAQLPGLDLKARLDISMTLGLSNSAWPCPVSAASSSAFPLEVSSSPARTLWNNSDHANAR